MTLPANDQPPPPTGVLPRGLVCVEIGLFALLLGWLALAATWVRAEYYDGLETRVNAMYFLGESPRYSVGRTPLPGLLMAGPEWIRLRLDLHPLDMRPHHALMQAFHALYLLATYALVARLNGRCWATLLAFVAAAPTYLFFSYAPFLSHDLVPGLLLLLMVLGAGRFLRQPSAGMWAALVALGAAAALTKHTYALFWVITLAAAAVKDGPSKAEAEKAGPSLTLQARWGNWLLLFVGAGVSGGIAYLVLAWALAGTFPDTALLRRPLEQMRTIGKTYDANVAFPLWMYARNLWAFGLTAMVAMVPALAMAWRAGGHRRRLAAAWILAVAAIHAMGYREVRYLGFLAPLTAALLPPVFAWLWRERAGRWALITALALDVGLTRWPEMAAIGRDAYVRPGAVRLLNPLSNVDLNTAGLFFNWKLLTFEAEPVSPLAGDRYHGKLHIGVWQIQTLFKLPASKMTEVPREAPMAAIGRPPPGSLVLWSSGHVLVNPATWRGGPAAGRLELLQTAAVFSSLRLTPGREPGTYVLPDGRPLTLRPLPGGAGSPRWILEGDAIAELQDRWLLPELEIASGAGSSPPSSARLRPLLTTQWLVEGWAQPPPPDVGLTIHGFEVQARWRRGRMER